MSSVLATDGVIKKGEWDHSFDWQFQIPVTFSPLTGLGFFNQKSLHATLSIPNELGTE